MLPPPRPATFRSSGKARRAQSKHTAAAAKGRPPQSFVGLGEKAGTCRLRAQHRPPRPMGRESPPHSRPSAAEPFGDDAWRLPWRCGIPPWALEGPRRICRTGPRPPGPARHIFHVQSEPGEQPSMGIATAANPAVPADPQARCSRTENLCAAVLPRPPLITRRSASARGTTREESRAADPPRDRWTAWRGSSSAPSHPGARLQRIAAAPTPTAVLGVILLPFFPPGPAAMGRPSWPAGTLGSLS